MVLTDHRPDSSCAASPSITAGESTSRCLTAVSFVQLRHAALKAADHKTAVRIFGRFYCRGRIYSLSRYGPDAIQALQSGVLATVGDGDIYDLSSQQPDHDVLPLQCRKPRCRNSQQWMQCIVSLLQKQHCLLYM